MTTNQDPAVTVTLTVAEWQAVIAGLTIAATVALGRGDTAALDQAIGLAEKIAETVNPEGWAAAKLITDAILGDRR